MKEIIDNNENVTSNSKQVEILKKNFPNCFDRDGKFLPEKLNSIINDEVEISSESYELSWLGKKYARLLANQEVTTMLTEDVEHNSKPENINSQNLYIEGDNLEVLKHMVNSYSNQIKMIYIDPPYNTEKDDFTYNDTRKFTVDELAKLGNMQIEEANNVLKFVNSNSNSHSAWLTFMFPRLYVARELLKSDGVIFISIDDNEMYQLKQLCDDVFGEQNFLGNLVWRTTTDNNKGAIITEHEYILCYAKNKEDIGFWSAESEKAKRIEFKYIELKKKYDNDIKLIQAELRKWIKQNEAVLSGVTHYKNVDEFGVYHAGDIANTKHGGYKYEIMHPITQKVCKIPEKGFRFKEETMLKMIEEGNVEFGKDETTLIKPKKRIENVKDTLKAYYYEDNRAATTRLEQLFKKKSVFSNPKSTKLISRLVNFSTEPTDIILDFFSGSGSTADAIIQNNFEKNRKNKYILVQIDESLDMVKSKQAYDFCTNDLQSDATIPTIAKERIKRASNIIKDENMNNDYFKDIDLGFKVFKIKSWVDTNYFDNIDTFNSDQTELLVTNNLSNEDLADLLLTWKLYDGIEFTKNFKELMLDDYIVHYVNDKAYFMYKGFTTRNIIQLLEELDDISSDFVARDLIVFASNFTSKEQRELVEAINGYKNKKKIKLKVQLRY